MRPVADKRKVVAGIFWIVDTGAKWKDLSRCSGAKSTVHRWFKRWAEDGIPEMLMREAGHCAEERGGSKLYDCFINATFSKAKGGGDGIDWEKVGKSLKIGILIDAKGLPVSVDTAPAERAESHCVQQLFPFMLTEETPPWIIGERE